MEKQSKASQRDKLILQFGRLLAPIHSLAERTPPPTSVDYRVAVAAIDPDLGRWGEEVNSFATVGSCRFGQEANDIMRPVVNFCRGRLVELGRYSSDSAGIQLALRQSLKAMESETLEAIDCIPIEWESRLLDAKTPFTVYMHVRDAMNTAKKRIHLYDRYLRTDFFHLYLRDISRSFQIRLVTTQGNSDYGVTSIQSVSALASVEFTDYQLIKCHHSELHDRNLRIDDQIFFLGPSISDAGMHPTNFSPTDSGPAAHSVLDAMIAKGTIVI